MPNLVHNLKTQRRYYQDVLDRKKTFEWRKNDRGFAVGDILILQEWDEEKETYTGRSHVVTVRYMIGGGQFGIPDEYCIMGI